MLCAGLDLSRQRLDVCVLDEEGRTIEVTAASSEVFGLRELVARISRYGEDVTAVIESMNGARFVHEQLELYGWDVEIADAVRVKGLAPLAAKTDKSSGFVYTELVRKNNTPQMIDVLLERVPVGRLASPAEIGRAVAFLMARENEYITGQTIAVDGGFACT